MSSSRSPRHVALLMLTLGTLLVGPLVGSAAAQSDAPVSDDTVQTTSTLPTDNRELGNSLPKPGQGMEPQDPGDPGGWLQQSLFFLICAAIVVISLLVWRSSRKARSARSAAGQDPVSLARARGEGVRASPKDPG